MTDQVEGGADTIAVGRPTAAAVARCQDAAPISGASHAAETRRLYAADWGAFVAWCRKGRHAALPASPATVAAYLASLTALRHGALARRAAAIADQHRRGGHPSPGTDPAVRDVLRVARAIRRTAGQATRVADDVPLPTAPARAPVRRHPPPGPEKLAHMAARCLGDLAGPAGLAGLRDRALLLLTASGLGGERLLALDREHIRLTGQGAELAVPRAGRGPGAGGAPGVGGGAGEVLVLARRTASAACPVRALEDWLHSSDTRFGPVFRKVDRWGNVEHRRLRADALRRIFRRRAKALRPRPAAAASATPSIPGARDAEP